MTRRCELTGKLPMAGQLRSHAENKTKRKFRPNLCEVTLISDALRRKFRLRVSAHALKRWSTAAASTPSCSRHDEEELSERCLKHAARRQEARQGAATEAA